MTHLRINCRDEKGDTPLLLATLGGHAEAVELLLQYSANPNAKQRSSGSAVRRAWRPGRC